MIEIKKQKEKIQQKKRKQRKRAREKLKGWTYIQEG